MAMSHTEAWKLIGPFCCICFDTIPTPELFYTDPNGDTWDVCIPCALEEWEMTQYCFNTGCESPWD